MIQAVARFVTHYPRWVLAFWLSQLALALPLATQVGSVLTAQTNPPPGTDGQVVRNTVRNSFSDLGDEVLVLLARSEDGLKVDDPVFLEQYDLVLEAVLQLGGLTVTQDLSTPGRLPLIAEDGSFGVTLLRIENRDYNKAKRLVQQIRATLAAANGLELTLAGGPATFEEVESVSERDARRAEIYGLPISLVVLIVGFGALVASALPLLVALTSISLSLAGLFLIGNFVEFAVFTQSVVTMLALATGIDYALLMVNRFREELRTHSDPREAAERTALTAGRAVVFSGITVMVALSALLVPPSIYIRSIGIGSIFVLFVSVLVSITALPALLALLGHRVNRFRLTTKEPGMRTRRFWTDRAVTIMKRPRLSLSLGVAVLVVLSLPAFLMKLDDPGPFGLGKNTDSRIVVEALDSLGLTGILESVDILIDFEERGFFHPSSVRAVSSFVRDAAMVETIAAIVSPVTLSAIPSLLLYQYFATPEAARSSELAPVVELTVSRDDRYVLVQAVPNSRLSPTDSDTLLERFRVLIAEHDLPATIGGAKVLQAEWIDVLYSNFPLALGIVYLATLVLLGIAFRSLLIPIKSIILNTLTIGATYGILTLVFQVGIGASWFGLDGGLGFVDTSAPLFIFAMVFGLSMDYEVFLVARMYEAHQRGLEDRQAIISAITSTGGVISSAAAIMIVVFSTFAFSEVALIKTLGIGLTVAIFLDATLVRMVLVPAVMVLAGKWNWWLPKPIARWATRVDLRHE